MNLKTTFVPQDHRFAVQQIDRQKWERATAVNAAADYLCGYTLEPLAFLEKRPEPSLRGLHSNLLSWSPSMLNEFVNDGKSQSLAFLSLMLTGACNADCGICFTDRRMKPGELDPEQRDRCIREAHALGAQFVYVAGEGEPTIDPGFWRFLETCRDLNLPAVVFTNGIALSDDSSSRRYFGMNAEAAVQKLSAYPVHFYFKLWSTDANRVSEMMGIPSKLFHHVTVDGLQVPTGLARLLDLFPISRVGIEVVIDRRNADEAVDEIIPFAARNKLSRIVEMIQHNGRVFGTNAFDPDERQTTAAAPHLSATSCTLATCKAVVTSRGYLSPRIAVMEEQIPAPAADFRSGPLFELLHQTSYLVERRYQIADCLCESIPVEMACSRGAVTRCAMSNVEATALIGIAEAATACRVCEH